MARCEANTREPVRGKVRRCGRKAGHQGDHHAPLGGGDATFWPQHREPSTGAGAKEQREDGNA